MELQGKKALVTGSRRGIGQAIALELARAGCDVGLNDIEKVSEAERSLSLVTETGRTSSFTIADIGSREEVDRLFEEFLSRASVQRFRRPLPARCRGMGIIGRRRGAGACR